MGGVPRLDGGWYEVRERSFIGPAPPNEPQITIDQVIQRMPITERTSLEQHALAELVLRAAELLEYPQPMNSEWVEMVIHWLDHVNAVRKLGRQREETSPVRPGG